MQENSTELQIVPCVPREHLLFLPSVLEGKKNHVVIHQLFSYSLSTTNISKSAVVLRRALELKLEQQKVTVSGEKDGAGSCPLV